MIKKLILFSLVFFTMNVFAGTRDPSVSDDKYIEHGKQFNFVGQLEGSYKDGSMYMGSAVAIDDHHILTAAHVVKTSISATFIIDKKQFIIRDIKYHKNFDPDRFGPGDIAIGYSTKSFGLDKYPDLYVSDKEVGSECSIAGYGITGTFETGAKNSDLKLRAGTNIIDEIENDVLVCSASETNKTKLEFLIASGDSGGGLFIDGKLAGINSSIMTSDKNPNSSYNDESCHTR
ncbi:hypothetical protein EBR43_13250, partial [bacterium]|nr:hypothetical protein [bacterium]